MFDNLRKIILQHSIPMVVLISLAYYGGDRLYINWMYNKCEALKEYFIILAIVAIAASILNASHWGKRPGGGNPNYQGNRQ